MKDSFKKGLPTMKAPNGWYPKQAFSGGRGRQIQKTFNNLKITVLCGFVTILVLRGTIGAGYFGTPAQDFQEIKDQVHRRKEPSRVLTELKESSILAEEEESEPEPDPNLPYSLGPAIQDWDEQRAEWLQKNPHFPAYINKKPRILLVTGSQPKPCDNPVGDHYLLKSLKNKIDYCRLHGIEIFYNMAHLDREMAGYWAKLPLLRKLLLQHPEVEWIWWMDSDAMFTDIVFELPTEKYKDYNLVVHGWDELVCSLMFFLELAEPLHLLQWNSFELAYASYNCLILLF